MSNTNIQQNIPLNKDTTNELVGLIDDKINSRTNEYTFSYYFPSVNRYNPRSNMYRPYLPKEFPIYPANWDGVRDISTESGLYGIEQRIGLDCDYFLGLQPTTNIHTQMGLEQPHSEEYWISQFGAVEGLPIQSFKLYENTKALQNDTPNFEDL